MRREWKRKSFVTAGKTWLMKVFFIAGLSLPSATAVTPGLPVNARHRRKGS